MKPVLTKINNYGELKEIIRSAGAWFIGAFIIDVINNYEKTRNSKTKRELIDSFHEEYCRFIRNLLIFNREKLTQLNTKLIMNHNNVVTIKVIALL